MDCNFLQSYLALGNSAEELACSRLERLEFIWRVVTKTWKEYLDKPELADSRVWDALTPRFKMTDLVTPVVETIINASHGGKIVRRIEKCFNQAEVEEFLREVDYDAFVKSAAMESYLYGTAYPVPGWRRGRPSL